MRVRYVIGPEGKIDASDRGLAYGDGLFETMALRRGRVRHLELHFDRLRLGAERLQIPLPERGEIERRIADIARDVERGHLKLILTRGTGPRGYAPPPAPEPTIVLTAAESANPGTAEIRAVTLSTRLGENEKLAGLKHLCRLEQVLGRLELNDLDADEGLMLSTSGMVIGGTSRNLFAVLDGRLRTPELARAGIAGVMRRVVLEAARRIGLDAEETRLTPADLVRADELFMTNALVGIQSLSELDGRRIPMQSLALRLREALDVDEDG